MDDGMKIECIILNLKLLKKPLEYLTDSETQKERDKISISDNIMLI